MSSCNVNKLTSEGLLFKFKLNKDLPKKLYPNFTPELRERALLVFIGTLTSDEKEKLEMENYLLFKHAVG